MIGSAVLGGGFDAAALVDGDVNDGGTGLHGLHHGFGDQFRGQSAGDEDGTHEEVGVLGGGGDVEGVGGQGLDAAAEEVVDLAQAEEVAVKDGHASAHAHGNLGGGKTHGTGAEDNDVSGLHASGAAHQEAHAAFDLGQHLSAHLGGHAAGDFRHGSEQGQEAVVELHGFVSDADDLLFEKSLGQGRFRSEVQVGVEDQAFMEEVVFRSQRFLHFHDHVAVPAFLGGSNHLSAGGDILFVGDHAAEASALLHEDGVTGFFKSMNASGSDADTEFLNFDFGGDTYTHLSASESSMLKYVLKFRVGLYSMPSL